MTQFDFDRFHKRFEAFVSGMTPRDGEWMSVDEIALSLRLVRDFLAEEQVPEEYRPAFAHMVLTAWLDGRTFTSYERAEAKRKWAKAIGFDVF